jgi:uncharacterized phage protein gp47/JayE
VENRPALSAIAYRAGTFASFRHAMLQRVAAMPDLRGLQTRTSDDYAVTVLDLWATIADILTFYQERIANQAFLRTATERDALLRLARLVGYELRPGVAATTLLAFTLERDARLALPPRLRVQSVPAEGEKPQKFETLGSLNADGRLNRLRVLPRPTPVQPLAPGSSAAYLAPGPAGLAAGVALAPGDRLIAFGPQAAQELNVREVRPQNDLLRLAWQPEIEDGGAPVDQLAKVVRTFRLHGHRVPDTWTTPSPAPPALGGVITWTLRTLQPADYAYPNANESADVLYLDGRYEGLKRGAELLLAIADPATAPPARTCVRVVVADASEAVTQFGPTPETVTRVTLEQALPAGVPGFDRRHALVYELAGAPIPFWRFSYPERLVVPTLWLPGRRRDAKRIEIERPLAIAGYKAGSTIAPDEIERGRTVLLVDDERPAVVATVARSYLAGSNLVLAPAGQDPTAPELGLVGSRAEAITALASPPLVPFPALTAATPELLVTVGTVTRRVALNHAITSLATAADHIAGHIEDAVHAADDSRGFTRARVLAEAERLLVVPGLAGAYIEVAPTAGDPLTAVQLGLDRDHAHPIDGVLSAPLPPVLALSSPARQLAATIGMSGPVTLTLGSSPATPTAARQQLANALRAGGNPEAFLTAVVALVGDRLLALPGVPGAHLQDFLVIEASPTGEMDLDASRAALLGNVAPASHGEGVANEVVGDGDAAQSFQRFVLQKSPLTHLPAPTETGLESTLRMLVNGVRWHEAATLFGRGPDERVFVARTADDGTTTVQFGDGHTGARPPSGRGNIVAGYRHGAGVGGRVRARALTNLLDRPTGLKAVANALPADGGADRESLAQARQNAPATVLTFGRAVSLRDFAALATATGEVAKARATWVWRGASRVVHLTVAAQGGGRFSGPGLARIHGAMTARRDPNHALLVDNFARVPIVLAATLHVHPDHVAARVAAEARAAVLAALSFEALAFAQPIHLSDVYRVLQDVAGVVASDINLLHFKDRSPTALAERGADAAPVQEHLRIYPARAVPGGVLPAEQAWVEVPSQDLVLLASGGLPE